MRTAFFVLRNLATNTTLATAMTTLHWSYERTARHNRIVSELGTGKLVTSFVVNTEHPNGNEIHNIMDNGIILIQNERTGRVITELIARPAQLTRYWEGLYQTFPANLNYLLLIARENQKNGCNEW